MTLATRSASRTFEAAAGSEAVPTLTAAASATSITYIPYTWSTPHPYDIGTTYTSQYVNVTGVTHYSIFFSNNTTTELRYDVFNVYAGPVAAGTPIYTKSGAAPWKSVKVASSTGIIMQLTSDQYLTYYGVDATVSDNTLG